MYIQWRLYAAIIIIYATLKAINKLICINLRPNVKTAGEFY